VRALAWWVLIAVASCKPASLPPSEGMAECAGNGPILLFAVRIDTCPIGQAIEIVRGLDDINRAGPWTEYTGKLEHVKKLRELGCPAAILCTDANAYGTARRVLGEEVFVRRHSALLEAAERLQPTRDPKRDDRAPEK
jgi:hypothetical protein